MVRDGDMVTVACYVIEIDLAGDTRVFCVTRRSSDSPYREISRDSLSEIPARALFDVSVGKLQVRVHRQINNGRRVMVLKFGRISVVSRPTIIRDVRQAASFWRTDCLTSMWYCGAVILWWLTGTLMLTGFRLSPPDLLFGLALIFFHIMWWLPFTAFAAGVEQWSTRYTGNRRRATYIVVALAGLSMMSLYLIYSPKPVDRLLAAVDIVPATAVVCLFLIRNLTRAEVEPSPPVASS